MTSKLQVYRAADGSSLDAGGGRAAKYKVQLVKDETYALLERQKGRWVTIFSGQLHEIEQQVTPSVKPTIVQPREFVHDITKAVIARVGHMPGIDSKQVNNYIFMLLSRNQKAEKQRILNTRWVDIHDQPVYLLYVGDLSAPISMRDVRLVDSLSQAQKLFSGITQGRLPDPIQWSDTTMDYTWDPTMEVLNLSTHTVEHIFGDRAERFPEPLSNLDSSTLLRNVKEALFTGQQKACRDCTYALPTYSRKYDTVGMMLPLHIYTRDSELPEAVMLLSKTLHGYSLVTLITPQQAYISVRAFRDPETTWLKGALL